MVQPLTLTEWWATPDHYCRNPWLLHESNTGAVEVYVHRFPLDKRVLTVASVNTVHGWGAARHLYRTFCRDIPTIAEQILNPELDVWLARTGWSQVYYDLAEIPTRVNQAFMQTFPDAAQAGSAYQAVYTAAKGAA